MFGLTKSLDIDALARRFRADGRVRIPDFLQNASELRAHLCGRADWRQVLNAGDKLFELDRATRAGLSPERAAALDAAVHAGASEGFQYRFENIRTPDAEAERARRGTLLDQFASWLSGGEARRFLRAVCGASDIQFADAQATIFSPGDFLTGHDDQVPGKHRRAAYVLGLTPVWRVEWGGLLLFHDAEAVAGVAPGFNTLDLFAVPRLHSVSLVSPAARERRLSVTGWLRSRDG